MKSFYEFAERAKRHRLMREVGEAEPAAAQNNMAAQNAQKMATPPSNKNATNPPEGNDSDLFAALAKNWKNFYAANDNKAAFARLQATDFQQTPGVKEINQTLGNLSTQLDKLAASLAKPQQKPANNAAATANNAGSNTAGASAGAKPAAGAAPQQAAGGMGQ
jgi:hypothetical protein